MGGRHIRHEQAGEVSGTFYLRRSFIEICNGELLLHLVDHGGEPGGHEDQVTQPCCGALLLQTHQERHLAQPTQPDQLHGHLQHHLRLLLIHARV